MDDRLYIPYWWYQRAIRYWLLAKTAKHHFDFQNDFAHIYALSIELILKTSILLTDPNIDTTLDRINSKELFPEGHNIRRLIERWQSFNASPRIVIEAEHQNTNPTSDLILTPELNESLDDLKEIEMTGRYMDGNSRFYYNAIVAGDILFFGFREKLKISFDVNEDDIDRALSGNLGKCVNSNWLKRVVRKSNYALPDQIIID